MKFIKAAIVAGMLIALQGCAASYVKYDVSGGGDCPPVVVADTAMGVSVHVNDGELGVRCHAQKK